MILNQLIFLIFLSFGLLIITLILMIKVFIDQLKKTDEDLILLILIGIVISFLISVILGMIQDIL